MPDSRALLDRILNNLHYDGTRAYTRTEGNIDYLDGRRLSRPADMPRTQKVIALFIVAAAVVMGLVFINNTVVSNIRASALAEQAVADNLAREASVDSIPQIASLINLDDQSIKATFEAVGFKIYDATELVDSKDMTLYKLPSDMTVEQAAAMYMRGVNSLNVADATKILNGSWYFATDRTNGTSMVVRYADFSTGDPQIAVQSALAKEGFDVNSISESGVDESENTYSLGTVEVDGVPYTWKISALPLTDMYSIAGLPEDACYVGVRLTSA